MANETGGFDPAIMADNMEALAANPYPGRGIVLGVSEGGDQAVQAYWVMGRSENSRNRILKVEDDIVKTDAFDPSKVTDPSLIIYNALRRVDLFNSTHIVSNGDQTDTVHGRMLRATDHRDPTVFDSFRNALMQREFEPDDPNFTPRITGASFLPLQHEASEDELGVHLYSVIKRNPTTGTAEHTFGRVDMGKIPHGAGICFHTYAGNGEPLPSFEGSPYGVAVGATAQETTERLWDVLDPENRVAIVTKTIDRMSGVADYAIINALAA